MRIASTYNALLICGIFVPIVCFSQITPEPFGNISVHPSPSGVFANKATGAGSREVASSTYTGNTSGAFTPVDSATRSYLGPNTDKYSQILSYNITTTPKPSGKTDYIYDANGYIV